MKKLRKILSLVCVVCCFMLCCTSAFASYAPAVIREQIPDTEVAAPYAANIPTSYYNLSANDYLAQISSLAANRGTYSRYYFSTGTGTINVDVSLAAVGDSPSIVRTYELIFYERGSNSVVWSGSRAFELVVDMPYSITGLNPNKFYYFLLRNTSSTGAYTSMDITGTITVSE